MAEDHFDHPYAALHLIEKPEQQELSPQSRPNDNDSANNTPTKLFKDSPHKVLVHESSGGASIDILNEIATKVLENSGFSCLTDPAAGDCDSGPAGNGVDSDATDSAEEMEVVDKNSNGSEDVDSLSKQDEVDGVAEVAANETGGEGKGSDETEKSDDTPAIETSQKLNDNDTHSKVLNDVNNEKNETNSADISELTHIENETEEKEIDDENGNALEEKLQNSNTDPSKGDDSDGEDNNDKQESVTVDAGDSGVSQLESSSKETDNGEEMDVSLNKTTEDGDDSERDDVDDSMETSKDEYTESNLSVSASESGKIILSIHRRKGRKRKRKSSLWTRNSPHKSRRLSSEASRRSREAVEDEEAEPADNKNLEIGTNADLDTGTGTEIRGETLQPDETVTAGEKRRRSCTPHKNEFIVGDEPIMEEVLKLERKHKSTGMIHHKKPLAAVKNVSEEELERYKEPFKHGWRREVVMRGVKEDFNLDGSRKPRPCDVYYFPPVGTKIRSMVQVADWLGSHDTNLTTDNFTFMRRAIGVPEGESVRHAAAGRGARPSHSPLRSNITPKTAKIYVLKKKTIRQIGLSRGSDTEHIHDDNDGQYDTPEVVIERDSDDYLSHIIASGIANAESPLIVKHARPPYRNQNGLGHSVERKMTVKKEENIKDEKMEMLQPSNEKVIVSPGKKTFKPTARKSTTQKSFKKVAIPYTGVDNLCSLTCPGMEGVTPLLHCNVCMCLFHNQCVNFYGSDGDFICLRCKDVPPMPTSTKQGTTVMKVATPVMLSQINNSSTPVAARLVQVSSPAPSGSPILRLLSPQNLLSGSPGPSVLPAFSKIMTSDSTKPVLVSSSSVMSLLRTLPQVSLSSLSSAITPSVTTQLTADGTGMISKSTSNTSTNSNNQGKMTVYPEIRPLIKEEPIDNSYDIDSKSSGSQASSEALDNLKSVLNNRINSPEASINRRLANVLDANSQLAKIPPQNVSISSALGGMNKSQTRFAVSPFVPQVMQGPGAGKNANNFRYVPVGPPLPLPTLPNMQFHPVQLPGLSGPGLIPNVTNNAANPLHPAFPQSGLHNSVPAKKPDKQTSSSTGGPVVVNAKSVGAPMNGQLLTLPQAVLKRLNLSKSLALKINNKQITVPPSGFFQSTEGLKVFLPPNTFPNESVNLNNVCVTNDIPKPPETEPQSNSKDLEGRKNSKPKGDVKKSKFYNKCCLMQKMYGGYETMEHIFKYLSLKEMLKISKVCRTWRMISMSPALWSHVSFSGCKVSDWQSAIQFLSSRLTRSICLIDIVHYDDANRTWHQLLASLQNLTCLQKISFGVVPSTVLQSMCSRMIHLESFCAEQIVESNDQTYWTAPTKLDVSKFSCMSSLTELKLRGTGGLTLPSFSFSGGLSDLASLRKLQVLHLTSLKNASATDFIFISLLPELKDLALGECTKWNKETFTHLQKLSGLKNLRLEHGGEIPDLGLGVALSHLTQLEVLELYNYSIAYTFRHHISDLTALKHFYIMPDNTHMAAESNSNTLATVEKLASLKKLTWAVPRSSSSSIILDDNDNTEQPEQWIPFKLNADQTQGEVTQSQYLNKTDLCEKLQNILPNTEINVIFEKNENI